MEPKIVVLSQGPHHVAVFKPHNIFVVGGRGVVRPTLLDLVRKIFGSSIYQSIDSIESPPVLPFLPVPFLPNTQWITLSKSVW